MKQLRRSHPPSGFRVLRLGEKRDLRVCISSLRVAAQEYRQSSPFLETRTPDPSCAVFRDGLLALWNDKHRTRTLKSQILRSQETPYSSICGYCGIDTATTLDHYLPRRRFPEFIGLSRNLIPSCSSCNTPRQFQRHGKRQVVHLVDDDIGALPALVSCTVTRSPLDVIFSVTAPPTPSALEEIFVRHFRVHKLGTRYRTVSLIELVDNPEYWRLSTEELSARALRMKESWGINSWRASLARGVLAWRANEDGA